MDAGTSNGTSNGTSGASANGTSAPSSPSAPSASTSAPATNAALIGGAPGTTPNATTVDAKQTPAQADEAGIARLTNFFDKPEGEAKPAEAKPAATPDGEMSDEELNAAAATWTAKQAAASPTSPVSPTPAAPAAGAKPEAKPDAKPEAKAEAPAASPAIERLKASAKEAIAALSEFDEESGKKMGGVFEAMNETIEAQQKEIAESRETLKFVKELQSAITQHGQSQAEQYDRAIHAEMDELVGDDPALIAKFGKYNGDPTKMAINDAQADARKAWFKEVGTVSAVHHESKRKIDGKKAFRRGGERLGVKFRAEAAAGADAAANPANPAASPARPATPTFQSNNAAREARGQAPVTNQPNPATQNRGEPPLAALRTIERVLGS